MLDALGVTQEELTKFVGKVVVAGLTGTVAAARVDIKAFRAAQARGEAGKFLEDYNWVLARKRLISGFLTGCLVGAGLGGGDIVS